MTITINRTIQKAIGEMKENGFTIIEHRGFQIEIRNNNWPSQYNLSVKDEGGTYIYESHNYCKNDVMLYKNIEMVLEYLGC